MTVEERAELAAEWKRGKYNCCQAVAAVLADQTNLTEEQLAQAASGFGSGMGNMQGTCGALVGAGLVAGFRCEGKDTKRYTCQISEDFSQRSGAVICKDLKGVGTGKVLCSCEECVRNAVYAYDKVLGIK